MQTLYHRGKDKHGAETMIPRKVIRSWSDKTRTIHLFADGMYGYPNGDPVTDAETLKLITAPAQYKAALAWWKHKGKPVAEGKAAETVPVQDDREYALYYRYEGKRTKDTPSPDTWMGYGFPGMPDWWGKARVIELDGVIFERAEEETEPATPEAKPGKKTAEDY